MPPVEDLDPLESLEAFERRDPGLEQLDPAYRTVRAALARRDQARGPGRVDQADEDEPGVVRARPVGRHLVPADLALAHHGGKCRGGTGAGKPVDARQVRTSANFEHR